MSVIATVIGVVILLIRKFTNKRISPKCHHIIWAVFVIALIFPVSIPSRISIYNYIDITDIKYAENENNRMNLLDYECEELSEAMKNMKNGHSKLSKDYLGKMIIPDIWFIVCIVKLARLLVSYVVLTKNLGNDEVKDERIIKILERCKKKLKIKKNIRIIRQNLVKTPSIIGMFNVKILFTDTMLEQDNISINNVIMHELSHYKRKDNFLNVFLMIMKTLHWFNPVIKIIFKYIKTDIELAADEMAIDNMDKDEKREYCKVIVKIAGMCSSKVEQVLGMANGVKEIEQRIDMIALKDKFEKYSIVILLSTIGITLLMWLLLYPTSYGMLDVPKLYLQLENGNKIEASVMDENDNFTDNTIKIKQNESVELVTEGGKCKDYIFYNKKSVNDFESKNNNGNVAIDKLSYFETGEYIYKFTLNYGYNQTIDYAVKFIVE